MNRANFLKWLAAIAGTTGASDAPLRESSASNATDIDAAIPLRRLGDTGVELPMLGLGGFHVGQAGSESAAIKLVEAAFEAGIRFFDTAESYQGGTSERWLGAALAGRRERVFLMSKSFDFPARRAAMAVRHLEESFTRLRTNRLDLWQLHSVRSAADVDLAFRPGGAFEKMLGYRDAGAVRFLGVTGHQHPDANLRALHYWDRGFKFDTMQLPLNPLDFHERSFQRQVLPELVQRRIGVIAMKTTADGALLRERICSLDECLRFAWTLPISMAVVGMTTPQQVRENAIRATRFSPMADKDRRALLIRVAPDAGRGLEWYKA